MIKILQEKPNWQVLSIISVLALIFNFYASSILTKSYEASLFPVPYFEAQLSFSAEKIKAWYAFLIEKNTMDIYLQTQHIDFVFIVSVLVLHVSVILLCSRFFEKTTKLRKILVYAAIISATAPVFDALENAVSYLMIADYSGFPVWQAILYSSFAAAKFAMFTFAYLVVGFSIIAWLVLKSQELSSQKKITYKIRNT